MRFASCKAALRGPESAKGVRAVQCHHAEHCAMCCALAVSACHARQCAICVERSTDHTGQNATKCIRGINHNMNAQPKEVSG